MSISRAWLHRYDPRAACSIASESIARYLGLTGRPSRQPARRRTSVCAGRREFRAPDIKNQIRQEKEMSQDLSKSRRLSDQSRRRLKWVAALILLLAAGYYTYFVNPLASDEEMIAHFRAHRADLETLVQSYREWEPTPGENVLWNHKPEIMRLMERSGVWAVGDIGPLWFDDPYSIDAAKRFRAHQQANREPAKTMRKMGTIDVRLLGKQYARGSFFRYRKGAGLFKRFVYYPVVPRVENSLLLHPFYFGKEVETDRVFDSLNSFPPDWKVGECVLRQLEPQWFIQMCRAT
jgi:hypothetical protein